MVMEARAPQRPESARGPDGAIRASLQSRTVTLEPGRRVTVIVEVTNTTDVIDGISAFVQAGPWAGSGAGSEEISGLEVRSRPELLPLFPDGTGAITLEITASDTFLAGTHELNVVVRSSVDPDETLLLPIDLEVLPFPRASLNRRADR